MSEQVSNQAGAGDPPAISRAEWLLVLPLAAGVIVVMLAALSYKVFELDRYFIPKELALNIVGMIVALVFAFRLRVLRGDLIDGLIAVFIAWSILAAVFATNHWLAQRAIGVSVSSALVFWGARHVSSQQMARTLIGAAVFAAIAAAITSLAQAYGVESVWFTLARAPGGTLGNRNFIAHVVAIALPFAVWCALTTKRSIIAFWWTIGVGILAATIVLSRSRAAYLAVALTLVISLPLFLVSRKYWRETRVGGRLARILLVTMLGGTIAVILPNTLEWKSDSPYLDSARNVVDYESGSGRGRIAQYQNSLKIVSADPIFGAGPGNWPVRYPRFAPGGDPSLADNGMTANPWPSSDWVAFISERGAVAAVSLLAVFAVLFFGSLRKWRDLPSYEHILMRIALAGTVVATMVVSAFDAVLLLPAPAFLVWLTFGAATASPQRRNTVDLASRRWRHARFAVVVLAALSTIRSAAQVMAMSNVGTGARTAGWVAAARLDPGSYRINQRLADIYAGHRQCAKSRPYARQALSLFPNSLPARRTARRCGIRR
ncbi:MAG TPA: O-antigen ligase family protein [Gemmatimonadaceae bacterium]